MTDLIGKVAVITGGSRGIGAATAVALPANGVSVTVVGRDWPRSKAPSKPSRVGRSGPPEDIAAAALFLGSSASSWLTGVTLEVFGGKVML